ILGTISLKDIHVDCVFHWGHPSNTPWNCKVLTLSPAASVCIVLVESHYFNGSTYRVVQYPNAVKATFFEPDCPFQLLRQIFWTHLPEPSLQYSTNNPESKSHLPPVPLMPSPTRSPAIAPGQGPNAPLLLPGHFYMIVDSKTGIDLLPVIIFIVLKQREGFLSHSRQQESGKL
ncbi:hypothetical protein B0J17DRAFT_682081, partial [Rhizoctonia solani]